MLADMVLKYIKAFLSWPIITLILALMFKRAISDFLKRLTKGEGPGGWRFEATTPSEQRKEIKDTPQPQTDDEIEKYISQNPKEATKEYKRLLNGYFFEKAFNVIYGTQMALLEHLSTKGDSGDKYVNLITFYNNFLKRSRFTNTQMADYLAFLKDAHLIEYFGEGMDLNVKITPYGLDFLSYIKLQYPMIYKYRVF